MKRNTLIFTSEWKNSVVIIHGRKQLYLLKNQLDQDIPVPYLLLRHQNEAYKDYIWHWFLLTGYEEKDGKMYIKTATYWESDTFELEDFWNTGCEEKGGLIRLTPHYN